MKLDKIYKQLLGNKIVPIMEKTTNDKVEWDIFNKGKQINDLDIAVYALINSSSFNKTIICLAVNDRSYFMPAVVEGNRLNVLRYLLDGQAELKTFNNTDFIECAKTIAREWNDLPEDSGIQKGTSVIKKTTVANVHVCNSVLQEVEDTEITQEELINKLLENPMFIEDQQSAQVETAKEIASGTKDINDTIPIKLGV